MGDTDRLVELVKLGREERFLEYKESAPWGDLKVKLAKSAMGMANIRDGGTIVIGVPERDDRFVPEGMASEHLATYKADDLQAFVNRFAAPYVRMQLHRIEWDRKEFLAIVVHEFDEVPVVCKAGSEKVLRQGAIYTRSYRMPETREVQDETEMREIVQMAVEKGTRRLIETMQRVGVPLARAPSESASETFDRQLEGL